jgi:hypothetical protein
MWVITNALQIGSNQWDLRSQLGKHVTEYCYEDPHVHVSHTSISISKILYLYFRLD